MSRRSAKAGMFRKAACEDSPGEGKTAGVGNSSENEEAAKTSLLAPTWLQVELCSSSLSPHGLGCEDLESQVEGAVLLDAGAFCPPGHSESLSQPVHSFLLRQNVPQQQSSIWTACAVTVDKARRNARVLIFRQCNRE